MTKKEQKNIFDEWLDTHKGIFFKVVRAYAFNETDRDDLFQEIAIQVWKSIPNFRHQSTESTWIYRVSLYAAMAWSKKERLRKNRHKLHEHEEHVISWSDAPKNEKLDWLFEQIAHFNKIDRSIIMLMFDGFSYRDIATTLGITESNVGVKINRLKKRLTALSLERK